jgi:hypothetical protein
MSYRLNKTNGELLVDLVDGQIDTRSTDLTLVGRNYKGYGEAFNENFIKLLENFAKTSSPSAPLVGQLWYDTAEERLKIYTGETFRSATGAVISQTRPNLVAGDLWIDSLNDRLYFFDGSDVVLVGPQYTASQGKTGVEAFTVLDENGQDQTVLYLYINGVLTGIYSRTQFRPRINIIGFPVDQNDNRTPKRQLIQIGFNPASTEFWWRGTASTSRGLVSDSGEAFTEANFMKTDRNTSTTGSIAVQNPAGLSVGVSDTVYAVLKIDTNFVTALENQRQDRDFTIRTRRGNTFDAAFYADASTKRVGIFTESPTVEFDVAGSGKFSGSLTVDGNLIVSGDTTFLDVANIRVEDKNIELAATSTGTLLDNAGVDGAGIIVKSSDDDKTLTWEAETSCWTSSEDFDLVSGKSYKINNVIKLSANRIDDSIIYAEGLISIGTLVELQVDQINLNDSTISSSNPLNITSNGIITINSQRITGVDDPTIPVDVANKRYVDDQIDSEPVILALDVTGFSNPSPIFSDNVGPHADIKGVLDYLYPATNKLNGVEARVYASSYFSASVTGIDINSAARPNLVSVYVDPQDSSTPQLESVIQSITFDPITASANLQPSRAKIDFVVNSGVWQWVRTTPV